MRLQDFIFSYRITFRLARHLLFWSMALVFFAGFFVFQHIDSFPEVDLREINFDYSLLDTTTDLNMTTLSEQIKNTVRTLAAIMVYTYLVTYWLVPNYLMKRRFLVFGSLALLVTAIIEVYLLYLRGLRLDTPMHDALLVLWMAGLSFVNDGPPVFCCLFLSIKMVKTWYIKQEEESTLIRENTNAELQLLKAQVHPHFLFNTLNNIYSFALNKSTKAPQLVLKLSAIMKYMVYDCNASLVSVDKEINMIMDYIGLEKVRYGNRLRLEVQITGDLDNKYMPPLLLIPFVENSFKHGTSRMIDNSWIRLTIDLSGDTLHFRLSNSKPGANLIANGNKGIGVANVKKRLQLIYPGQHSLMLDSRDDSFTVEMKVPLHQSLNLGESVEVLSIHSPEPAYVGT